MTTPKAPLRAILLIAVSSEQQAADDRESLKAQRRDLQAAAEREGWTVIDVIEVPGFSRDYYNFHEFAQAAASAGITAPQRMFDHWARRDFDVFAVRDGSRFGREQSIFAEVVARTLDSGARLFTLTDGWIDSRNREMFISMAGFQARREITNLVERRKMALEANRPRGLPAASRLPRSHKAIRDDKGKIIGVRLDETLRPEWDALAALVIEGVYWQGVEGQMFERYGYGYHGRPAAPTSYRQLVFNPAFWGHSAMYYTKQYSAGSGLWRIEDGQPIPPGVQISYNVLPAVYEGDQAEQIRQELRRREAIGHGEGRKPKGFNWFRGLFICDVCGYTLVSQRKGNYSVLVCISNWEPGSLRSCPAPARISEDVARQAVTLLIERVLSMGIAALTQPETPAANIEALRQTLVTLESRAARIISQRLEFANTDVDRLYADKLRDVSKEITAQQARITQAEQEIARARPPSPATLDELQRLNVEGFWKLSAERQNQLLHALLGDLRIPIRGKIVLPLRRK